jgi:hypothetical protein
MQALCGLFLALGSIYLLKQAGLPIHNEPPASFVGPGHLARPFGEAWPYAYLRESNNRRNPPPA